MHVGRPGGAGPRGREPDGAGGADRYGHLSTRIRSSRRAPPRQQRPVTGARAHAGRSAGRLAPIRRAVRGGPGVNGVVLAGGLGTRLYPMTKVVNKHLLDVFDEPMVYYPLRSLVEAGVNDIVVVTGREVDQFEKLLGEGEEFGARIRYAVQEGESGIADA